MSEPISLSRFIATIDGVRYFGHPRMVVRYQRLVTENEELREAVNAALILLGNLVWADPGKVTDVIMALKSALDPEQDDEDEEPDPGIYADWGIGK